MEVVLPILWKSSASYAINKLVHSATTYLRDQYFWETDLEKEVKSLRRLLPHIQAVVGFAEDRLTMYESSNPALIEWLWQFRDGIDEAEEVLDELKYREMEKKSDGNKSRHSTMINPSIRATKKILKCDDVLERLRTCVKNLNTSASYVKTFLALVSQTGGIGSGQMQQEMQPPSNQSRITSSLPGLSFKGRDEEKERIIQYLLRESVEEYEIQSSENVHCLPLVAIGGMGKTALAQQVFDHFENVNKEYFDIKIWVCDSLPVLDAFSLMKKILEYLTVDSESGLLELLPVKLKEKLHFKRFLLVLDDPWDDKNQKEWEKLCTPLLSGQKGSWIILTTRSESVAKMVSKVIRGTMKPMMLQGLSNDECRSLLYEHAFSGQDSNGFPQLKEIGEVIVEELKGIPLLAKSIGGALNSELDVDHWRNISRSEVWTMPQNLDRYGFIPALTLSYKMLPPHLKRCFSYCGIFPQDYQFNKQKLVCMWVAAGLIYPEESEDIANSYFDMLCSKSFFDVTYNQSTFQESKYFYNTGKEIYTMHDMLNGLARHVSRYECYRIVGGTPSHTVDYNVIRHISIAFCTRAQLHDVAKMVCKFKHLRTLWIQYYGGEGCQQLDDFIRDACKSPRRIRVLIVESNFYEDQRLKNIGDLVKLRFLEISAPPQPLSISICKLYFLQVLIGYNIMLAIVSNEPTNLRHIYGAHEHTLLLVAKVGQLTSLQELCFPVGTKPGYRIDELMNMNNLRQLSIVKLSNVQNLEEVNKVNLVEKHHLTSLELKWDGASDDASNPDVSDDASEDASNPDASDDASNPDASDDASNPDVANNSDDASDPDDASSNPDLDQQEVLAALKPPPTIRKLIITGYKGGKPAPWMNASLSWLESLELYACTSLKELPPLWKLQNLKFLKLNQMKAIRSLGCHFSSGIDKQFPVLEKLVFDNLPLWEEWNGADDYIWFPRLRSFIIKNCPRLKKVPDLPLSIENLCMQNLGLEALPRSYKCSDGSRTIGGFQQLTSLELLEILKCSKIVLGEEHDQLLPSSLKELELENIDEHKLLASYLRGLTLLTRLNLHCFPGMESLPLANELEHLTSLQKLAISDSEALISPGGLYIITSLKSLKIYECTRFLSEPGKISKGKTSEDAASSSSVFVHSASDEAANFLPSSLISLKLENSQILQQSLDRCLQGLTSLEKLALSDCDNLHKLTALQEFQKLRKLSIFNCEELSDLESLTAFVSLRKLKIVRCPKLVTLRNPSTTDQHDTKMKKKTLPSLEEIYIDNIFYLLILPISESLKNLHIVNETEDSPVPLDFTCLPPEIEDWLLQHKKSLEDLQLLDMPRLQSLPATLKDFSSLKLFGISYVPELESLPMMPPSITFLRINHCSAELKKRCQKNIGQDWPHIQHISQINIYVD